MCVSKIDDVAKDKILERCTKAACKIKGGFGTCERYILFYVGA